MITNFQSPNLQREVIRKKNVTFFLIFTKQSTHHPLLAMFEAPRYNSFQDIKFSKSKSAEADNSKKINQLFFSNFTR